MLNCSQLSRKNNTHNHNSGVTPLLIKSQLQLQIWARLVFSIQCSHQACRLLSAERFQKSFVIECYNYILLLTAVLQAEFHKVLRFFFFLFIQDFLSRKLTTHKTAGEGRGPFSIPLYHFHPLTNIQTLCSFACEISITYF